MANEADPKKHLDIPADASLPMTASIQLALIGHLVLNEKLFLQVHHKIRASWFADIFHGKLYQAILDIYATTNKPPTFEEIENSPKVLEGMDVGDRNRVLFALRNAIELTAKIRWEAIKPELTEWLQAKILQSALVKSAGVFNRKNFKEAAAILGAASTDYREAKFEDADAISFENPETYLKRQQEKKRNALTTGLALLDEALLTGSMIRDTAGNVSTTGSLQDGDTTIVMAPSNTGKTSTLISIARHNVFMKKNVLFITHEGRPDDIRNKILRSALNCTEDQLFSLYETENGRKHLNNFAGLVQRRLTYVPFNKAGMKVEDAVAVIRRMQEDRLAKTGHGYDLLVVDYPAKLSTEQARGALAMRNVIEIVYDFYVQLALEYGFHSLLAIQTNREGSKVNAGLKDEGRLLMMEDVQEAWGPMTAASNVITLNRSPKAKKHNRMTLYVAKSRSSETGKAIVARTNFAHCLTHSNEMGAIGYDGEQTFDDSIDFLLNDSNMRNQMVTPDKLFRSRS
jgi:replicative DNA helicase